MDEQNLQRNMQKDQLKGEYMRTGRIPYPKHVWSPAGGWYGQPANWKANTAIMGAVILGLVGCTWMLSAQLEERPRMPPPDRFFPSRYWSKQIREHEAAQRQAAAAAKGES